MGSAASTIGGCATELFNSLDTNQNGTLEESELDALLQIIAKVYSPATDGNVSDQELSRLRRICIHRFDRDRNGKLTMDEFTSLYDEVRHMGELVHNATSKFTELDVNKSGSLDTTELIELSKYIFSSLSVDGGESEKAMFANMLHRFDANADGSLDQAEFAALFQDVYEKSQLITHAKAKFQEFDLDSNGVVEAEAEIGALLDWAMGVLHARRGGKAHHGGEEYREVALKAKLMRRIDLNGDGKLNMAEFLVLYEEVMHRLEMDRVAERKFHELDVDKSGALEKAELAELARWYVSEVNIQKGGTCADEMEACRCALMERIDANKDGKLSLAEFTTLVDEVSARVTVLRNATVKFHELDVDGSGQLEAGEVDKVADYVLRTYFPDGTAPLSMDQKNRIKAEIMDRVDSDKDGKLSLEEFVKLFEQIGAETFAHSSVMVRMNGVSNLRDSFHAIVDPLKKCGDEDSASRTAAGEDSVESKATLPLDEDSNAHPPIVV